MTYIDIIAMFATIWRTVWPPETDLGTIVCTITSKLSFLILCAAIWTINKHLVCKVTKKKYGCDKVQCEVHCIHHSYPGLVTDPRDVLTRSICDRRFYCTLNQSKIHPLPSVNFHMKTRIMIRDLWECLVACLFQSSARFAFIFSYHM